MCNLTALALVLTEWVKLATCGLPSWASDGTLMLFCGAWPTGFIAGVTLLCSALVFVACSFFGPIGSVHRSVDGSFFPLKIIFPLYHALQFVFVNITLHPASHKTLMPINDAIDNLGTTCPTNTIGSPGIVMLHVCVDFTFVPSGRLIVSGRIAGWRFSHGVPSVMRIDIAPVLAIACDAAMAITLRYCGFGAPNSSRAVAAIDVLVVAIPLSPYGTSCDRFDVTIVLSSSSIFAATFIIWVGSEY